jgi:hypothetical protein
MGQPDARDFFDRAREVVSAGLFVAGAAAVVGSLLDWVTFTLPEPLGTVNVSNQSPSPPISGFDLGDGRWVMGAGIVVIVCAFLLVIQGRALWAGIALIASIVIGSIAISDYRGVGDLTSDVSRELDLVGEPHAATGLVLVAIAALIGLIVSVAGVAATPRRNSGS